MTRSAPAWVVLAHLLRPQGRKGEVLAELFTDFPERFEDQRRVFLAAPGFVIGYALTGCSLLALYFQRQGRRKGRDHPEPSINELTGTPRT